jgi:hypothetical protein
MKNMGYEYSLVTGKNNDGGASVSEKHYQTIYQ